MINGCNRLGKYEITTQPSFSSASICSHYLDSVLQSIDCKITSIFASTTSSVKVVNQGTFFLSCMVHRMLFTSRNPIFTVNTITRDSSVT